VVDGGLSDSGAVLAHEVGHQLVRVQATPAAANVGSLFMWLMGGCLTVVLCWLRRINIRRINIS
jgi:hypothetical protein